MLLALAEGGDQLRSLGAGRFTTDALLLHERFGLPTVLRNAFGRAIAEVGAVMIVGGNIDGVPRVMTTTVALESSKGDLPRAARPAVAGSMQTHDLVPEGRAPRGTMVFQRPFVMSLSVRWNVLLGLWLRGVPAGQREPLCRQAV